MVTCSEVWRSKKTERMGSSVMVQGGSRTNCAQRVAARGYLRFAFRDRRGLANRRPATINRWVGEELEREPSARAGAV